MSLRDDAIKFDRICRQNTKRRKTVEDRIHGTGVFMFILRKFYYVIQDISDSTYKYFTTSKFLFVISKTLSYSILGTEFYLNKYML